MDFIGTSLATILLLCGSSFLIATGIFVWALCISAKRGDEANQKAFLEFLKEKEEQDAEKSD